MDKFSKIGRKKNPKENIPIFTSDYFDVINYEDWLLVREPDLVVCIPYLIETNQVVLRHEYIPTFKYVDGQDYHITIISGSIKEGESKERALLREIEEEAGIIIRPEFKLEFEQPLFMSKSQTAKYHPCIIPLTEVDYHEVIAKTDGSRAEKLSKSVKIDTKYLSSINASDLITSHMINQVKKFLHL